MKIREGYSIYFFRAVSRFSACVAAAVLCASLARADINLGPGETLDWNANTPSADEKIIATGGTIIFNSDTEVVNNFYLGGEVTVAVNNGAMVRFCKTFYQTDPSGRLVMPRTFWFGSSDANRFAFLPENSIAFAQGATDAELRFTGRVSMQVLPDNWTDSVPYDYEANCEVCFYGVDMVTSSTFTIPEQTTIRMTSPTNISVATVITVPSNSALEDRPAIFDPATSTGSGIDDYSVTTEYRNDIVLNGGVFRVNTSSTHKYWGNITGSGSISIAGQWGLSNPTIASHYFLGDISGLDANSTLTIEEGMNVEAYNNAARISSDFYGTVRLGYLYPTSVSTVSFGFSVPEGSGNTNENWRVGALRGGDAIGLRNGEGGARLQYYARQHIHVNTLSGKLAIYATATNGKFNTDDLTVENVADDTVIYVKNGLRLHFGTVGRGVKIRYMASPVSSNVVEVASGAIEEISFLSDQRTTPLYLRGTVEKIVGTGTIIVADGNVRIGAADATVDVQVRGGTVTFGNGVNLDSVLGSRPALWLDASDTEKMTGTYNSGWADTDEGRLVLGANPAITFNGNITATYTNGFPLIEKWFDKRPEQTWTYGWQDRCVGYTETLYPLVYPYLVPNGLNGRAYMSFGKHGTEDMPVEYGRSRANNKSDYRKECRRMPLMHDMADKDTPSGNAVNACATILVFGSQQGGGRAILGSYYGNDRWSTGDGNYSCGANYLRGGTGYDAENALFASGTTKSAWVNGENVDPAATSLNSGWQIISVTNQPAFWRSLGEGTMLVDASESGGQNYAEVISFTNAISAAERVAVENYLAMKWGLTGAIQAKCSVTVSAGATVKGAIASVTGAGTWELDIPESRVALDGSFAGAVSGIGDIAVTDAANLPSFAASFSGAAEVSGGNLSFTYANGAFAPALVSPNADLSFPAASTVTVMTNGAKLPAGDYTLVEGKALSGLTDCTLVHDLANIGPVKLVRTDNALVMRVSNNGLIVIFR